MAKSLDSIKKLDPGEMKKYRKIVLDYIGEKEAADVSELADSKQKALSAKKVDGLNKTKDIASQSKAVFKKSASAETVPVIESAMASGRKRGEVMKERSEQMEAERFEQALRRQQEERKRVKQENRQYWLDKERVGREQREGEARARREKIMMKREQIRQEKIKLVEAKRAEERKKWEERLRLEEQGRQARVQAEEAARLERQKHEQEIKRVREAERIAKLAAGEKRRIRRQKVWKSFGRNFSVKAEKCGLIIRRSVFHFILFLVLGLVVVYLILCLAVLKFKMTNSVINWALKYVPAPAVFTNQGLISYANFRKIEDANYLALDLVGRKQHLARWLVLDNLKKKYGLPAAASGDDLAVKFVLDKDFNEVGLARINKISSLIKSQAGVEPLAKYADDYNDELYLSASEMVERFGSAILQLAVGQTSGVLARADGYYIVERIDAKKGGFGVKYLFIKARTLERYLDEELQNVRVFILAN